MRDWIEAARPKTLIAAFLPVAGAVVLALSEARSVEFSLAALALVVAFLIQIATNFWNDYFDFQKGSDTEHRIGPRRFLQRGIVTEKAVRAAALVFNFAAFAAALPIFLRRGWFLAAVGAICLFMTLGYTGGPFPLAYLGLGEIFVLFFFGWVATFFSFYVATGEFSLSATVLGLTVGLLSCVLITINNLRDYEEDRANGKRTLVVIFGRRFGLSLLFFELAAPYALAINWRSVSQFNSVAHRLWWLPLIASPIAWIVWRGLAALPMSRATNKYLGVAAVHALTFLSAWSVGVLAS